MFKKKNHMEINVLCIKNVLINHGGNYMKISEVYEVSKNSSVNFSHVKLM